ncbi:MAG: transcription antitermination factor NusB [Acidobacteriaceae bacterium]
MSMPQQKKFHQPPPAAVPAKNISPARKAALQILTLINQGKGHCDELLQGPLLAGMSQEDRNLCTTLVMGVLRWQIALDAQIIPFLQHPDKSVAEPVAIALRMGAFQLLHLDRIPPHAAISESVELCRAAQQPQATGMVNAILRKIARLPKPLPPAKGLALRFAHPAWLVERWTRNYGRDAAAAICAADQTQPAAVVRSIGSEAAEAALAAKLTAGKILHSASIGSAAQVAALVANHPQQFQAMDEGSQLVAEIAASGVPADGKILDCCAAPGGKTLILAERNPEAEILACDSNSWRLQFMRKRLQPVPYAAKVRFLQADATQPLPAAFAQEKFDRILCDVPCSGTGTLARNPEIRHHLQPEDLERHAARQKEILHYAMLQLAPGGRLVYSTCSLEPEENEAVVEACLQGAADFRKIDVSDVIVALDEQGILQPEASAMLRQTALRDGYLRTLPGVHPCDGFFAAVIERSMA